ncbi:MAG: 23S rRNA (adenine(2503)-C(2))-methyltransferase @ tRNA (adenine(37)-C(2))-methyltransferase, partial [uncultured Thermomicrobiales bacterium]
SATLAASRSRRPVVSCGPRPERSRQPPPIRCHPDRSAQPAA